MKVFYGFFSGSEDLTRFRLEEYSKGNAAVYQILNCISCIVCGIFLLYHWLVFHCSCEYCDCYKVFHTRIKEGKPCFLSRFLERAHNDKSTADVEAFSTACDSTSKRHKRKSSVSAKRDSGILSFFLKSSLWKHLPLQAQTMAFSEVILISSQQTPVCIVNQSVSQTFCTKKWVKLVQLSKQLIQIGTRMKIIVHFKYFLLQTISTIVCCQNSFIFHDPFVMRRWYRRHWKCRIRDWSTLATRKWHF